MGGGVHITGNLVQQPPSFPGDPPPGADPGQDSQSPTNGDPHGNGGAQGTDGSNGTHGSHGNDGPRGNDNSGGLHGGGVHVGGDPRPGDGAPEGGGTQDSSGGSGPPGGDGPRGSGLNGNGQGPGNRGGLPGGQVSSQTGQAGNGFSQGATGAYPRGPGSQGTLPSGAPSNGLTGNTGSAQPGNLLGNLASGVVGTVNSLFGGSGPIGSPYANPGPGAAPNSNGNFFSDQLPRFVGDVANGVLNTGATPTQNSALPARGDYPNAPGSSYAGNTANDSANRALGTESGFTGNADPESAADASLPGAPRTGASNMQAAIAPTANEPLAADGQNAQNATAKTNSTAATLQNATQGASVLQSGTAEQNRVPTLGAGSSAAEQTGQEKGALTTTNVPTDAAKTPENIKEALVPQLRQNEAELRDTRASHTTQQGPPPADPKRLAEALELAAAKLASEMQTRNPADARFAEMRQAELQARADAEVLARDATDDKGRPALTSDAARNAFGETAKPGSRQGGFGEGALLGGASESVRQAMDWVGQQVRDLGGDAKTGIEGVNAMRVVAGLIVASAVVLVVIGVLYALRVIFVV